MISETITDERFYEYIFRLLSRAGMSYSSTAFFFFISAFLLIFPLMRGQRAKRLWILAGSISFYLWSGLDALTVVTATALTVYAVSLGMEKIYSGFEAKKEGLSPKEQVKELAGYKKRARVLLAAGLILVLGSWIAVKICRLAGLAGTSSFGEFSFGKSIIIPLGISYYTLSCTGYLMDVYWRKTKTEHNFIIFLTAMLYFPHIVEGPIGKYTDIMAKFRNIPKVEYKRYCFGIQLMIWGYFQKMIVAERLSVFTSEVFGSLDTAQGVIVLIAAILCAVQLYADFNGCMDIVRGISQCLGIELAKNFRQPFFSRTAREFWQRWHITLGGWTKEYIYIPISVNPGFLKLTSGLKKKDRKRLSTFIKNFVPLIAVWIFTGLWHGTGIDYLVWGLYWCGLMTLSDETAALREKFCGKLRADLDGGVLRVWQQIRTFMFFVIGRTLTAAGSLTGFVCLWVRVLCSFRAEAVMSGKLFAYGLDLKDFAVTAAGILVMYMVDLLHEKGHSLREETAKLALPLRWLIYYAAIFSVITFGMYGPEFDASIFIYGNF